MKGLKLLATIIIAPILFFVYRELLGWEFWMALVFAFLSAVLLVFAGIVVLILANDDG